MVNTITRRHHGKMLWRIYRYLRLVALPKHTPPSEKITYVMLMVLNAECERAVLYERSSRPRDVWYRVDACW